MKNQALFSSKDKSKKLKCRLLQYLFGALKVNLLKKEDPEVHFGAGNLAHIIENPAKSEFRQYNK